MPELVLASSSRYRQALLQKLGIPFVSASPDIDESRLPGEPAIQLCLRLAVAKARALATRFPEHLIIGSDQVARLDNHTLGKPGTKAKAREQLRLASGKRVDFLTGICLFNSATGAIDTAAEPYSVYFRTLTPAQIADYIEKEEPLDCAGSFKSEGLGIALFERLEGDDPNALIGLPLIRLTRMLESAGVTVL